MKRILLVKYGEIALRGKNRYLFENKLIETIQKRVEYHVIKEQGRILIENPNGDVDYDITIPKIITIFGVIAVCPAVITEDDSIENLQKYGLQLLQEQYSQDTTFKVETKRAVKQYPMESREISSIIGGYVLENMDNMKVDVHSPEVRLYVEIRNRAYLFTKIIKAVGGLPAKSAGKALVLLSGGIDSPVALFLMAKRGVDTEAVYFHSPPYTSERAKQKVADLAEQLSAYCGNIKLHVVNFTDIQLMLKSEVPPEKLTTFLKRAMLKCAEKIGSEIEANALIVGDSLGQVASQTLQSIYAIHSVTDTPILTPLAGLDKQQIIDIAVEIGTYEISIRPYEDCCTIFVPDRPETKPRRAIIESIESKLENLQDEIQKAVSSREIIDISK